MKRQSLIRIEPEYSLRELTEIANNIKNGSEEDAAKNLSKSFLRKYGLTFETDGKKHNYEMVSRNTNIRDNSEIGIETNAVCIVPRVKGTRIYVVCREFRYAINDYCWQFPAGLIDNGETDIKAASRELKEETGYEMDRCTCILPGAFSSAGMTDEKVSVVFMDVVPGDGKTSLGSTEDIEVFTKTEQQLMELIMDKSQNCCTRLQCIVGGIIANNSI